jgi:hypothetical protein
MEYLETKQINVTLISDEAWMVQLGQLAQRLTLRIRILRRLEAPCMAEGRACIRG